MATLKENPSEKQGDENAIWALQGDAEWRIAWSRLIAYAWMNDENFAKIILDPTGIMQVICNYNLPEGTHLRVRAIVDGEEITSPERKPTLKKDYKYNAGDVASSHNGWEQLSTNLPTEVILTLPPKPENLEFNAFALADYEATGKTVPFTS